MTDTEPSNVTHFTLGVIMACCIFMAITVIIQLPRMAGDLRDIRDATVTTTTEPR